MEYTSSYMVGRMTEMKALGLVTWTEDRPAKYSRAYAVIPADLTEIALMIAAHGPDAVRAAVKLECRTPARGALDTLAALGRRFLPKQASEETSP